MSQLELFEYGEFGIEYLEEKTDEELFNLGAIAELGTDVLLSRGYSLEEINSEYRKRATPFMISYERGERYLKEKLTQGARNPHNDGLSTPERVGEEFGVSKATIERDAQFTKSIDHIEEVAPELKNDILQGETNLTKQEVIVLGKMPERVIKETQEEIKEARKQDGNFHISSKENDWYTPSKYIESARTVLGRIDLDPATSELAQKTVNADKYYTIDNSGLEESWKGNVWMNPPYSMPEIQTFIDKLLSEDVDDWIVLTNNSSDTGWFHKLLNAADVVCFTKGRVGFENIQGDKMATRQGQTFFYKGSEINRFEEEFKKYGAILEVKHEYTS